MIEFNEKYRLLQRTIISGQKVKILIIGLGSVGNYLLDYLVSQADEQLEIIVAGRNVEKMQMDVNIVRTAATIRGQLRSNIYIAQCDLNDVDSIAIALRKYEPHIIGYHYQYLIFRCCNTMVEVCWIVLFRFW